MTDALVAPVVLVAVFAHHLGVHVGWKRGFTEGFQIAEDLEDGSDEAYFRHYGGQIEAGRRREN